MAFCFFFSSHIFSFISLPPLYVCMCVCGSTRIDSLCGFSPSGSLLLISAHPGLYTFLPLPMPAFSSGVIIAFDHDQAHAHAYATTSSSSLWLCTDSPPSPPFCLLSAACDVRRVFFSPPSFRVNRGERGPTHIYIYIYGDLHSRESPQPCVPVRPREQRADGRGGMASLFSFSFLPRMYSGVGVFVSVRLSAVRACVSASFFSYFAPPLLQYFSLS